MRSRCEWNAFEYSINMFLTVPISDWNLVNEAVVSSTRLFFLLLASEGNFGWFTLEFRHFVWYEYTIEEEHRLVKRKGIVSKVNEPLHIIVIRVDEWDDFSILMIQQCFLRPNMCSLHILFFAVSTTDLLYIENVPLKQQHKIVQVAHSAEYIKCWTTIANTHTHTQTLKSTLLFYQKRKKTRFKLFGALWEWNEPEVIL